MVYCGKPSPACAPCRKRRAKCDLKQPGCTQCARKFMKCPGYRSMLELSFRDETQIVVRRSRQVPISSLGGGSQSHTSWDRASQWSILDRQDPTEHLQPALGVNATVQRALSPSFEDRASAYFMTTFLPNSNFSYLLHPSASTMILTAPTSTTLHAASLATYALAHPTQTPPPRAQIASFAAALAATNATLADPSARVSDGALVSVLLLALVEALRHAGRLSPTIWAAHVTGSLELLRLRGLGQVGNPVSRALAHHAAANVRHACLMGARPLPKLLPKLVEAALEEDPWDATARVAQVLDRAIELRIEMRRLQLLDVEGAIIAKSKWTFLKGLRREDDAAAKAEREMPEGMRHVLSQKGANEDVFGGAPRQYPNLHVVRLHVGLRMIRLFLTERAWLTAGDLLCNYQDMLDGDKVDLLTCWRDEAWGKGGQLIRDILSTVPYFMEAQDRISAIMARYLVWPLSHVGESCLCLPDVKVYVVTQLRLVAERARLAQADEAASMVEESALPEDWIQLYTVS